MGFRCYFDCYCDCCFPGKPDDSEGSSSDNSSPLKPQHDLESCQGINETEVPLPSERRDPILGLNFKQICIMVVCMSGYMALMMCAGADVIPVPPEFILFLSPLFFFGLTSWVERYDPV